MAARYRTRGFFGASARIQRYPGGSTPGGSPVNKIFGALAAVMLTLVLLTPPAEARCRWNGYRSHCTYYRHHHYGRYWHPYPYYGYYAYPYYRPYYACIFPFCW
jgi:hypothetical protein